MSLFVFGSSAFAALPTVNTFTLPATAVSPIPVTAFTASDSDGNLAGYIITTTSSKPAASDPRWTTTPWTQITTTSFGNLTFWAWAKDSLGGVSTGNKSASTNVVGTHIHSMNDVAGLGTALAGKANATHTHKYGKVAIVATSGGDYIDPVDAMNHINEWCGTPSSLNPCLLKIMPGVYALASRINLQDHVDIEGSGAGVTQINGGVLLYLPYGSASCEIRSMTIEASSFAMELIGDFTVKLSEVKLKGGTGNSDGAMTAAWGKVLLDNVTLESLGGYSAIFGQVNLTMMGVTTSSPFGCGFFGGNSTGVIYNSRITDGIWFNASGALNVANTLVNASSGITKCVNCFDSNFDPIVGP